ncbi:MAG: hypothetical protein ACI3XA_09660 [Clostridia bacterium]
MDILSMLQNMDKETLEKGLKEATAFLSTPQGQNAAKMLSEGKMPDGGQLPEGLKEAAEAIKGDKNAQNMLGELIKRRK